MERTIRFLMQMRVSTLATLLTTSNMTEKSHIESNFDIDGFKMNTLLLWEQRNLVICFSPFEQAVKLSNTYACHPIWDFNL